MGAIQSNEVVGIDDQPVVFETEELDEGPFDEPIQLDSIRGKASSSNKQDIQQAKEFLFKNQVKIYR